MASKTEITKSVKEQYAGGEQKSRHAMQEFGPGKKEFIFCPHGEAVYYRKSWHHTEKFFRNPPSLQGKDMRFKLCPAHQMIKNKQYEGEIVIKNIPAKFRRELLNFVENFGERAMRRDVLDRLLELRMTNDKLRITTSENQLAQKLAQKISEAFKKKVVFKISRAQKSDVVRIRIDFFVPTG